MVTLNAQMRDTSVSTAKKLLQEGKMPAVIYGPKQEALSVEVSLAEFTKVLKTAGESTVIDITGLEKPLQILIHEVTMEPVKHTPIHADFYAIEKGAKLEVAVPLVFIGESAAVKAGANLVKVMHEIELEADAAHLPHDIQVDISSLANIGDQIHVRDLKVASGVVFKVDADQVVALIQEVKVEEETPSVGPDMSAIEVEKKGKTEEAAAE
jgi:large subunit ribosomal protein L25